MQNKVNFRYSDVDFVSYLMTIGYTYDSIEIVKDKRNNQLKGYVHFIGDKEDLLYHFNQYNNGLANANVLGLRQNRKKITKLIKSEILIYQANNIK